MAACSPHAFLQQCDNILLTKVTVLAIVENCKTEKNRYSRNSGDITDRHQKAVYAQSGLTMDTLKQIGLMVWMQWDARNKPRKFDISPTACRPTWQWCFDKNLNNTFDSGRFGGW